jgi:TIR domain
MLTLFFSYAHRDEELRNELEVHLAMLKRQGIIATWHDRCLIAGEPVDPVISEQLEKADIVLLLASPYFLASDYCYDIEMQRALERHEAGTARVIPVILHPCDWQPALFGKLRATPPDGKPISTFANQHEAFLAVTKDIRKAAEELQNRAGPPSAIRLPTREVQQPIIVKPDMRSSNLRLKKPFSVRERDQFLDEAFEYIARFFEGSLLELGKRNAWIEGQFKRTTPITLLQPCMQTAALQHGAKFGWAVVACRTGFYIRQTISAATRALTNLFGSRMMAIHYF